MSRIVPGSGESIPAVLPLRSYAGVHAYPVEVIGETPKRYRVRLCQDMRLPGRHRWGKAGDVVLVPKDAVEIGGGPGDRTRLRDRT